MRKLTLRICNGLNVQKRGHVEYFFLNLMSESSENPNDNIKPQDWKESFGVMLYIS